MRSALARHDQLLRAAFLEYGGDVFKTVGDGFCVAFDTAPAALNAVVAARLRLDAAIPGDDRLLIRAALHTGAAERRDNDYFGPTLNRVARVLAIAHGDQVLLTHVTAELVRDALPEDASLRLCGEHLLRDFDRPERIFQLIHPAIACSLNPLRSVGHIPNNLPVQLTSFVGRGDETETIRALLPQARLVTLTGAGGSGKTRLALRVAEESLERYADGVWFVDLSPLADPDLVAQTVNAILSIPESPNRTPIETIVGAIEHRSLLLILDNCEHLLGACAQLAEQVLRRASNVAILATSRAALGIAGETTRPVPPLSLPPPNEWSPSLLLRYEGVRLFVERAAAIQPSFTLTDDNSAAITRICRRLDGIPLAIELAAARARVLTPSQIADRLSDRFRLLTAGSRTALPRQQTLRALVDWSYELLEPPERVLLQRLAVFAGGWSLEAAEAVAAGDPIEPFEVLDLLAQLVDKSLVVADELPEGRRFRFLETLREYALEKLNGSDEDMALHRRHLEWFSGLAEATLLRLSGPDQATLFDALDLEHENLRAGLTWAEETGQGLELAARLAHALSWFWLLRGYRREGEDRLGRLVARIAEPSLGRAYALAGAGMVALQGARFEQAREYLTEAVALARNHADTQLSAIALARLGLVHQSRGEFDAAWTALEESQALFDTAGCEIGLDAPISVYRAQVAKERGDLGRAIALFEDAIAESRRRGDRHGASSALRSVAEIASQRGDLDRAEEVFRESVGLLRGLGDKPCATLAFEWLGNIARRQRRWERAAQLFAVAAGLREETGFKIGAARGEEVGRDLAAVCQALGESAFNAIWSTARHMSLDQGCAVALEETV